MDKDEFQLAELLLARALNLKEDDVELLCLYGYVNFMLRNYRQAIWANQKVLRIDPDNAYANKGMGLTLYKLGNVEKGIKLLKKAIELSDEHFMDPYFDLAVVYCELDRKKEAIAILEEGRRISPFFIKKSQELYDYLVSEEKSSL